MARLRGIPFSKINPNTMKGFGDVAPPEPEDPCECPDCGEELEVWGKPGMMEADCPACGYHSEPDYEAMAEARGWI